MVLGAVSDPDVPVTVTV
jgi:hypothetical protein